MLNQDLLLNLRSRSENELLANKFNLSLFASGYEPRAGYAASKLEGVDIGEILVFGFESKKELKSRRLNDQHFERYLKAQPSIVPKKSPEQVVADVAKAIKRMQKKDLRILIDYSSMPRLWYGRLLEFFRYLVLEEDYKLCLWFVYSAGDWHNLNAKRSIKDIYAIPGCEGVPRTTQPTLAVIGLGYDVLATSAVLDQLEPSKTIAFYAADGSKAQSSKRAVDDNRILISAGDIELLALDYLDVPSAFRKLSDVVVEFLNKGWAINLVPLGPKPHCLTCIAVCHRFPEVTCLYVDGEIAEPQIVKASGELSICSYEYLSKELMIGRA